MSKPVVSVLMPTFRQRPFISRAIDSLLAQSLTDWELVILDDASPDGTWGEVRNFDQDPRIRYVRLTKNVGMGAALNIGLDKAGAAFIAYLPSDDVFYPEHLASLLTALQNEPKKILAYSGMRHHYNHYADGVIKGEGLQLVQVMHRNVNKRWVERDELVTDDLERMYWQKLRQQGDFINTGRITCEWVDHPEQRHKMIREPVGGIQLYKDFYGVSGPLRFHSTAGHLQDEKELYSRYLSLRQRTRSEDGLKILLVGELAYNADRILALEEQGHELFGLWMSKPYWYNTVGPLPFGHVKDLSRDNWRQEIEKINPDVIYALLNWQAVPFAHQVMRQVPHIPFVWHFKEGPFICLEKGSWPQLIDLYTHADGKIFSSPEMRDWFVTVIPQLDLKTTLVLDGDLPKEDWVTDQYSPLLSQNEGSSGIHTVVPGRPIGLHPTTVQDLAAEDIHLHFYGEFTHGQWRQWIERALMLAPDHLHLHPNVSQKEWVREFSQYDAGWLHFFASNNSGEIRRADWDDLNYPARMATMAAAGLPMLQRDNGGSIVATQNLVKKYDMGLFFREVPELARQLRDKELMARLRRNVRESRHQFTFDHHVDRLVAFFHQIILMKRMRRTLRIRFAS